MLAPLALILALLAVVLVGVTFRDIILEVRAGLLFFLLFLFDALLFEVVHVCILLLDFVLHGKNLLLISCPGVPLLGL